MVISGSRLYYQAINIKGTPIDTIYNSILVIVDILIKYIYLELYKEVSIVEDLVYIFNKVVIIRYRILDKIVLDRDIRFTLQFQ